jgi:predicted nucleic-acid-binding protein
VLAVDTNVLVRYLTRDEPAQFAAAKVFIESNDVFVPTTVFLETEWVLRRSYGYDRSAILTALRAIAGLPRVKLEDPLLAVQALDWLEAGIDFADALHLAKAADCEAFVSFDRRLATAARRIGVAVRAP